MSTNGPVSVKSDRVGAVRRLSNRSFRAKVERFLAEGPQSVREAVVWRPDVVDEVFVVPDSGAQVTQIVDRARNAGLRVTEVPEQVLLAMTETVHPQGIAAVCRFIDQAPAAILAQARLVVILHEIRDPGNAGTILRTADAAGANGVIFTGDSVDAYNGKCVRSTAGSLFHIPFAQAQDLTDIVARARQAHLRVVATAGSATADLLGWQAAGQLDKATAWVFGNEARGLPGHIDADASVAIPIFGQAESLNLASAAAVCLYASAFAQQREVTHDR
jgi:TrmH family RNA methyltransferase